MPNFLKLCQDVARDSGTISDLASPLTTTGQTGRLLRIVHWTSDAYNDIQRRREDWGWMQGRFTGQTIANVGEYDDSAFGIAARFDGWVYPAWDREPVWSIFKTADGPAQEGHLRHIPYDTFRQRYMFGSALSERGIPTMFTITPQDEVALFPIPDDIYTVRGDYRKSPQLLAADADVPEMPKAHHEAIKWKALILMGTFDEAFDQMQLWTRELQVHMAAMERKYTPRIRMGGPLA